MKSMTGYGRGEANMFDRKFVVEIKAVNHRYSDINIKMPRTMLIYEDKIKKAISEKVNRGKIDVFVSFESFSEDDVCISVNNSLVKGYIKALNYIKEEYKIQEDIGIGLISRFPDVISVDKSMKEGISNSEISQCLFAATNEAIEKFVAMREVEGKALKENILEKLIVIEKYVERIDEIAPEIAKDYRKRLEGKLRELEEVQVDEARLLTEVLIFSDKACIDEEITRLCSHIVQMRKIVEENIPVGRKLDFLIQEMNREVNTIGSKSNNLEITNIIVECKSEIEKIREQIQNIE